MMGANLYQRYIKVMKDCGYIQKQGRNNFHNYNYAAAAQVLEKVNESCVENGIATIASPEIVSVETPTNRSGAQENRVTVKMQVVLTNIDDPKETMTLYGIGCGQDAGDKAVMKAQTAAMKYAWMMGLQISTGDDPEADADLDKRMHGEQKQGGKKPAQQTKTATSLREEAAFTATVMPSAEDYEKVTMLRESLGWDKQRVSKFVADEFKKKTTELDKTEIDELCKKLQTRIDEEQKVA